jgi:peptide/nickel transport system substrate-binding protein
MWWGEDGSVIFLPVLAESFEQVDELTWDFTIRQGVKFSDGSDLDIQDVFWSLSRDDPRPGNMIWSLDARIESYEKIDDWTIRMVTKYPMNNLYAWLCQGWTNIVSYDWVVATDNINNYPMVGIPPGTGMFMWYEIEPMVFAKMKQNPYWEGKKPKIDEIHIFAAVDNTARVMALEAGSFDFIFPTPIEAVEDLEEKGFKLWIKPTPIMRQIQINNVYPPFDDVRVRQALAHSINREELVPTIWGKYATIMDSPSPVGNVGYKDFPLYDYDPEKAKQLLAEAGYPDGVKVDFWVRTGDEKQLEAGTAIKTYAAAVGIDINLILMESQAMNAITRGERAKWMAGEDVEFPFHLNFRGWHADTLWAGDDLFSLYHSTQSTNRWYIDDPELDEQLEIGISMAPLAERIVAAEKAQEIWMENCYGVMLYAAPYIYTTVDNLENIYTEPNVYVWFEDSYFS